MIGYGPIETIIGFFLLIILAYLLFKFFASPGTIRDAAKAYLYLRRLLSWIQVEEAEFERKLRQAKTPEEREKLLLEDKTFEKIEKFSPEGK